MKRGYYLGSQKMASIKAIKKYMGEIGLKRAKAFYYQNYRAPFDVIEIEIELDVGQEEMKLAA